LAAGSTFQVFGWSRGYVGFASTPNQPTAAQQAAGISPGPAVVSSYSTDGVHWHTGQTLDTAAAGDNVDAAGVIRAVIEGPAGLLAVGWSGSCASEYLDALWSSTDGIAWKPINASKVLAGTDAFSITHVSGGAAGYIAVAYGSVGAWTSRNGSNWQSVPLNSAPFENAMVDDGTAIMGGYVIAGTAGTRNCDSTVSSGTPPPPVFRTPYVWWSADGSIWRRIPLPGAVASSDFPDTWVARLTDQSLLVVDGNFAWVSNDGQTWTKFDVSSDISQPDIISQGQHNVVVTPAMSTDANGYSSAVSGKLGLQTIDGSFVTRSVVQTGDVPEIKYSNWDYGPYGMVAIGPTGVVLANADGSQIWFGTPSSQ
jgi:hypothetical protein